MTLLERMCEINKGLRYVTPSTVLCSIVVSHKSTPAIPVPSRFIIAHSRSNMAVQNTVPLELNAIFVFHNLREVLHILSSLLHLVHPTLTVIKLCVILLTRSVFGRLDRWANRMLKDFQFCRFPSDRILRRVLSGFGLAK